MEHSNPSAGAPNGIGIGGLGDVVGVGSRGAG